MRRDQLEHAIRAACQIIGKPEVIVVGSQAILGTYPEDQLPAEATMSLEVDVLPIADDNDETARLADIIEGVAGEFSRSRSSTVSASTVSTWRRQPYRKAGASDSSRCRAPTRRRREGSCLHGLVPGQGGPVRRKALRISGEGPRLRCGAPRGRAGRSARHRGSPQSGSRSPRVGRGSCGDLACDPVTTSPRYRSGADCRSRSSRRSSATSRPSKPGTPTAT